MIYEYDCEKCDKRFDVVKPMAESAAKENCPTCGNPATKVFSCKMALLGTKIEDAEYNIGLGTITKSKRHREELAKDRGLIEVGNECPNKTNDVYEKQRAAKRKAAWENE